MSGEGSTKRSRKKGVVASQSKKLEDFFFVAASDYVCCICGSKVKTGKRLTHEADCRIPPEDDDVIFVEEVQSTQKEAMTFRNVEKRRSARRKRSSEENTDGIKLELISQKRIRTAASPVEQLFTKAPSPVASPNVAERTSNANDIPDDDALRDTNRCPNTTESDSNANDATVETADDTLIDINGVEVLDDETGSIDLFLDANTDNENERSDAPVPTTSVPVITSVRTVPLPPVAFSQLGATQRNDSRVISESRENDSVFSQSHNSQDDITAMEGEENETVTPFALKAFRDIVARVYNDQFHSHLFDQSDQMIIEGFMDLCSGAQLLFCRLMMRKRAWIPLVSMKRRYGGTLNVEAATEHLSVLGLLDSVEKMDCVEETLSILSTVQLRTIAKMDFRLNIASSTKSRLVEELIEYSRGQGSLKGTTQSALLNRAKQEIGICFRVKNEAYLLFLRVLHIFSPDDMSSANLADGRLTSIPELITNLIHVLRQKHSRILSFPSRTGVRQFHQFRSRGELHMYVRMNMLEAEMRQAMTKGQYEECERINAEALHRLRGFIEDDDAQYSVISSHLRKYTAPWVTFRIVGCGVEVLEKLKKYEDAVEQLRRMIDYSMGVWCPASRSRWYERLALDLDAHLKKPDEALNVIDAAFNDESLAEDSRLNLFHRAKKITKSLSAKAKKRTTKASLTRRLNKLKKTVDDLDIPERTIDAELLSKALGGRNKTIFATVNSQDGSVTARNVEEVAKRYYIRQEGFTEGIHGEGSPWLCVFGMFFWDIINDPNVPDAFVCSQQWTPLDLNDPQFYARRRAGVDEKIEWIKTSSLEARLEALRQCWKLHRGKASQLVNWNLFDDLRQIERFVSCINRTVLAQVFQRLVSQYRFARSGFPDLLLWNCDKGTFKVVEVKGPGDRPSMKQRLWLDCFVKIGAEAEICWVKGVSGKRVHKTVSTGLEESH